MDFKTGVSWVEKWDEKNHALRREYSDGRVELTTFGLLPVNRENFVPIVHKRPAIED